MFEARILLEVAWIALESRKCLKERDGHTENTQNTGVNSYGWRKQNCGISEKLKLEEISPSNPLPFHQAAQTTLEKYLGLEDTWLVSTSEHYIRINSFMQLQLDCSLRRKGGRQRNGKKTPLIQHCTCRFTTIGRWWDTCQSKECWFRKSRTVLCRLCWKDLPWAHKTGCCCVWECRLKTEWALPQQDTPQGQGFVCFRHNTG